MEEKKQPTGAEEHSTPEAPVADGPGTAPAQPAPGDVVVPFEKIEELMAEQRAAARHAVEQAEPPTPEAPAPSQPEKATEQAPEEKPQDEVAAEQKKPRRGRPPKAEKAEQAAPEADKEQTAAKPRRGRPPKADKAAPDEAQPPKPRDKVSQGKKAATVKEAPAPEQAAAGGGAGPGAGIAAEPQTPTPPPRPVEEGKLRNQHLKALLLDNDIFQPPGHLPNLRKQGAHAEWLTGEAPSGAGIAVAHTHQVSSRLPDIPVVRALPEGCFQLLCFFRQRRRCRSVDDLQLIRQMDGGFIAAVMEVEPAGKLLPRIQGQQIQLQQQLCRTVLYYPEEIHQFPLDVVVNLKFAGFLPQQHSPAAAEDFNIASEFSGEHRQDDRQQVCLISNAGYRCSDRLSHAPFIIETAGTVPAVRLLYRP